ncbi:hypothetical protein KBY96_02690 [Cyanobium sp. ATX 6A2]|uniref:hypothetical protein n=1 Tax=Cyanobium sp. ATX 6A2 TaxID=2823700 RepID=UPI0020CDD366|nr:hypothetical protein [Cyanobium sp. ATX 6A2]MCP9886842.1 hypothetical protein [Cyanobium sp. ATX 6A2]
MAALQQARRRAGRLITAGLALTVAGGLTLSGCAQMGQRVDDAATTTTQAALTPTVNPVLDLLRQGQSQAEAGNLTGAVASMSGFQTLWSNAAPIIRPVAGDKWPAIEAAANTVLETFGAEKPTLDEAGSAIGGLLGPLSALVGQ